MKKQIIAALLVSASLASAATITVNQDTSQILDFSVEWGPTISEWGCSAVGSDGSIINWLAETSRNRNFYFVDLHAACDPSLRGFGLRFWSDPEYYGAVPTAYGSPNIVFSGPDIPLMMPLEGNPYGARFIYGVPEIDGGAVLFAIGLAGIALGKWLENRPRL